MTEQQDGIFPAVCPLDCPDTCGLLLHKENGKIVKVTGNPDHPITKGAICNKVRNMTERVYDPDRVLYPLKRIGPKGEGKFERISWEEAVDTITGRFKELIRTDGSESILPYSFYGNMGVLSVDGMDRRFLMRWVQANWIRRFAAWLGMKAGHPLWALRAAPARRTRRMQTSILCGVEMSLAPTCIRSFWLKARKRVLRWSLLTFIATGRRNGRIGSFRYIRGRIRRSRWVL